ncbi:MAG TPA: adenosylcobinamide-GDP ribazoletransferase [Steroidobacteraceae bacterium]|jgi:adenosylcobinamide-GDP ribazoletransferase|nr:adenosylcobinamide-GDP ribazoletransferase [Steroidobacteraceae bacterium]
MTEIRLLLTAVQYFTRIRVPASVGHAQEQLAGAVRYLPVVGLIVGASGAATLWLAAHALPAPLPAILATVVTVLMTGALHEDGLADTCDGLGGGATRERALEIMKDPRIGAFGAIALILVLLLKISALSVMPVWTAMAALVAAHAFSRFCAVLVSFAGRYVGSAERSRAAPVVQRVKSSDVMIAALFGLPALVLCGREAIVAVVVALVLLGLLFRWCVQRIGGYTGDTLGAAQQITETGFYVALLATQASAL